MHKIGKHISSGKILWILKNRISAFFHQAFLFFARHVNNMSIESSRDLDIIGNFRASKQHASKNIINGAKIFSWALHEADGRCNDFNDFDKTAWDRWLR